MIRPRPVLALLHPEGLDGELHRAAPRIVARRIVARAPPIFLGEPHRIAERIDLPLPLGDDGLRLGLVRLRPFELRRPRPILVDGVGVSNDQYAPRLPQAPALVHTLALRTT